MSDDPKDFEDSGEPNTENVVIPFRKRGNLEKPGKWAAREPQTLEDGTVLERLGQRWTYWSFGDHPLQSTCLGCFESRREEHEPCGFDDCDCFCRCGKRWPLWALFGLLPPKNQPIPPQLLGPRVERARAVENAEPQRAPERRRMEWVLLATVAVSVVLSLVLFALWSSHRTETPVQVEESLSASVDGGTEMAKLVTEAIPMPTGSLPGQLPAPCPQTAEEIKGYCWGKVALTPAQVKDGLCDSLGLYEPSEGWCRAHNAGYRPLMGTHRKNNAVDPQ